MDPVLAFVFAGSRGGPTRIRICQSLLERPRNPNMLATGLGLDYKTVEYNLRVLTKHRLVVCDAPDAYGAPYRASKNLLAYRSDFEALAAALRPTPRDAGELGKPSSSEPMREAPR